MKKKGETISSNIIHSSEGSMPIHGNPEKMPHTHDIPHTDETPVFVQKLLPAIKYVSNIIIVLLILALVVTILLKLYVLFFVDLFAGDFTSIINDLLLTLILIELFTILYSYLQKHYIKVERVVELGMISIIREMLFKVDTFEASKIYAVAVLLVAFGAVFFIEKYYSRMRNI
jgi:uncharacterized membrane protein (DUF373 family)